MLSPPAPGEPLLLESIHVRPLPLACSVWFSLSSAASSFSTRLITCYTKVGGCAPATLPKPNVGSPWSAVTSSMSKPASRLAVASSRPCYAVVGRLGLPVVDMSGPCEGTLGLLATAPSDAVPVVGAWDGGAAVAAAVAAATAAVAAAAALLMELTSEEAEPIPLSAMSACSLASLTSPTLINPECVRRES